MGIVQDRLAGLSSSVAIKGPCRVATTANITLQGLQTIDGVALAVNDRVLLKDQTDASENGIYYADTGYWTRAKDFSRNDDIANGTVVFVAEGSQIGFYETEFSGAIEVGVTQLSFSIAVTNATLQKYPDARLTSVDSAASLNSLFADRELGPYLSPVAWPWSDNGLGSTFACMRLGDSVSIPNDRDLIGQHDLTQFRPLVALGTDPMFLLNVNAAGVPVEALPLGWSSKIQDVWYVNRAEDGNRVAAPGALFYFAGTHNFDGINALGAKQIIKQSQDGGGYSDTFRATRIRVGEQIDSVTEGDRKALIELLNSGDGFVIEQVANDIPNDIAESDIEYRGYTLNMLSRTGGRVFNIINGDVKVGFGSANHFSMFHMEWGKVDIRNSSGRYDLMDFWMRGDQTLGVDDPAVCTPFNITKIANDLYSSADGIAADIHFNYLRAWSHPYGYQPNFTVEYAQHFKFERITRKWYTADGLYSGIYGSTQGRTASQIADGNFAYLDWNNYSHIASWAAEWSSGLTGAGGNSGKWMFKDDLGDLSVACSSGLVSTIADTPSAVVVNGGNNQALWTIATDNYFWKAVAYFDKIRGIGIVGSTEVELTLTEDSHEMALLRIEPGLRGGRFMIRLYRGTTSGSYDFYVDVPIIDAGILVDNGSDVAGYPWIARTPGAVDPVNTFSALVKGFELRPGVASAASEAYGRVEVFTTANDVPDYGAWRRGDKVTLLSGFAENGRVKLGWVRLTDCTIASPTHALFVDWMPIFAESPFGVRTSTQLNALADNANVRFKSAGVQIFNTTIGKPVWALGSAAADLWVLADGTTANTPV